MEVEKIRNAEQILIDNGIEEDEASTVLQAIGFALLDRKISSAREWFEQCPIINLVKALGYKE